jgi:hypothetical protein
VAIGEPLFEVETDKGVSEVEAALAGVLVRKVVSEGEKAGPGETIAYISQLLTLEPGDIIATGTPEGVGFKRNPPIFLRDGDVVEVEVEGIGMLRNPVIRN